MKRFLLLLGLIASPVEAQTAPPPANVTLQSGQPRAVTPAATYCYNGTDWVGCPPSGSGGSSTVTVVNRGAVTDGSGTLTTGGVSQQVFAANASRNYLMCQNPISATETLFVNWGAAASTVGGSIELAPGASTSFQQQFIPNTTVAVTAATTGHRFICKQG